MQICEEKKVLPLKCFWIQIFEEQKRLFVIKIFEGKKVLFLILIIGYEIAL